MAKARIGVGELIGLAIACVPFYLAGSLPLLTLVFVVAGSATAYVRRPMPMAKQLMVPGFLAGVLGTALVKFVARQVSYLFMVTSSEVLWWSAWFAFWCASLIISAVLRVRGIRPDPDLPAS